MSNNGTEEPLDRLNYFNGQRLAAIDLQTEQDYHIRVRRLFNKALFTPGIADGLEVSEHPDNPYVVVVGPGLALDALGREVVLLEETEVQVAGLPNTDPAWIYGNFLTIEYAEETAAVASDGCAVDDDCEHAWGGPTRIRATPALGFESAWPDESAGKILLAQVELDASCAVAQIHNEARKYVDAADTSTRTFALEGEAAIDQHNPKVLSFHVSGAPAKAVTLYLWASKLSSLFYTEIGEHAHSIPALETGEDQYTSGKGDVLGKDDQRSLSHTHELDLSGVTAGSSDSDHGHEVRFPYNFESGGDKSDAVALNTNKDKDGSMNLVGDLEASISGGSHEHSLVVPDGGLTTGGTSDDLSVASHHHTTSEDTTGSTGKSVNEQTGDAALTYVDDLRVLLDGTDITDRVLSQLGWKELGDGTSGHDLVFVQAGEGGTGPVALERIASLNEGEHTLELKVENDSGGTVRYNLYVE